MRSFFEKRSEKTTVNLTSRRLETAVRQMMKRKKEREGGVEEDAGEGEKKHEKSWT